MAVYSDVPHISGTGAISTLNGVLTIDDTNDRVGVNDTTPDAVLDVHNASAACEVYSETGTDGAATYGGFSARVANTTRLTMLGFGSNWTTSGAQRATGGYIAAIGSGGLSIAAATSTGGIRLYTGGFADANKRLDIDQGGVTTLNGAYVQQGGELARYVDLGIKACGLTTSFGYLWEDFDRNPTDNAAPPGWSHFPVAGTAAATSFLAGTTGGVSRLLSGATANSRIDQYTNVYLTHQAGTARWYLAARLKIPTAVDAQARAFQSLRAGTNNVGFGFNGLIDASNFIAFYDATFIAGTALTLAAVDTSWHVFECWVAGDGILRARIDGGATVVAGGAQASGAADAYLFNQVQNGTTAADRQMDRDWTLVVYGR